MLQVALLRLTLHILRCHYDQGHNGHFCSNAERHLWGEIMPKAKPSQVIVHRIELQETERATLEAALAGNFVTNAVSAAGSVLTGFGAALAPFSGVLTAIGAAYLAEKGIQGALDSVGTISEAAQVFNPKTQSSAYEYICEFLRANPEWDKLGGKLGKLRSDLVNMNASPILTRQFQDWNKTIIASRNQSGTWPLQEPAKSWIQYYPPSQFVKDSIAVLNPLS